MGGGHGRATRRRQRRRSCGVGSGRRAGIGGGGKMGRATLEREGGRERRPAMGGGGGLPLSLTPSDQPARPGGGDGWTEKRKEEK